MSADPLPSEPLSHWVCVPLCSSQQSCDILVWSAIRHEVQRCKATPLDLVIISARQFLNSLVIRDGAMPYSDRLRNPDALAINCVFTPNTSFAVLSSGLTSSAIPLTVVSFPCIAATSLMSVPRRGHKNWDRRPLRSQSNNVAAGCFFPRVGCFTCTHKCVHGFPHMLSSPCIQFFRVRRHIHVACARPVQSALSRHRKMPTVSRFRVYAAPSVQNGRPHLVHGHFLCGLYSNHPSHILI